jgi:hypothetical protein
MQFKFFMFELAKHDNAKFQLPSFYPDGLRQHFHLFSRKVKDFLKKIENFQILKKFQIEHPKRHLLSKFEVHQSSPNNGKTQRYPHALHLKFRTLAGLGSRP